MSDTAATQRITKEKKDLFPGAKFGLKSLREEKSVVTSKYLDFAASFSVITAVITLILLPYIHLDLVYSLWSQFTRAVNRSSCTCTCWDSTFKSNYEAGIPRYKHVYFNITSNSFKIWSLTIISIILLYESIRKICHLIVLRKLRYSMFILFVASIYPHYYSWWSFFNYWNDDYYHQFLHQSLFTFSELISTYFVVHLLNNDEPTIPWKLTVILTVAITHVLTSLTDQFGYNVIRGEGELHQFLRDVGFMLPDLLNICVPLREMKIYAKKKYVGIYSLVSNKLFCCSVCFIITTWITSKFL